MFSPAASRHLDPGEAMILIELRTSSAYRCQSGHTSSHATLTGRSLNAFLFDVVSGISLVYSYCCQGASSPVQARAGGRLGGRALFHNLIGFNSVFNSTAFCSLVLATYLDDAFINMPKTLCFHSTRNFCRKAHVTWSPLSSYRLRRGTTTIG